MRRNPFTVTLLALAGSAWLLAFMLWIVQAQVMDYATYDLEEAATLGTWMEILTMGGVVAVVGAFVIGGVEWAMRNAAKSERASVENRQAALVD